MPIPSGTSAPKTWKGDYDFAVDGGAVATITLRSSDGPIPTGSYIMGGLLEVDTIFTGAGASVAVQVEAAGDTVAAAAITGAPWSTTGRKSIIPVFTGATSLKTTAARLPAFVISAAVLTAGKASLILFYR